MKRTALALAALALAATAHAQLTMFENDGFQGRRYDVQGAVDNLANTGFNDTASSVIVRSGTWQVCADAYFRGRCVTLKPGQYPSLNNMGMNDAVSSAREIGGWGGAPQQGGAWGSGARAILFSQPGLRGRDFVIDGNVVRDLANSGFNDRASSLRVEQGYWLFCSDADFGGNCLTFAPGDYPSLPPELNNRISSGRRISERYPYRDRPNWQGYRR
jgi:hypothetical protein